MARRIPNPRRALTAAFVSTLAVAVGYIGAPPATAASKPPVKISGKVNNKGTARVTNGSASVEADNYYFKKTFLKTTPGAVTITLENESGTPHTFTIDAQDIDVDLPPRAKRTVMVQVDGVAPITFYCRFHRGLGMQGALFTKAGKAAKASKGQGSSGGAGYRGGY
jgi:plastocyanin